MEDHLHNDKLEEYFRKAFEEEQNLPESEGWDVPPASVWDGISAATQAPSAPSGLPWTWISIAALVIVAAVAFQVYTCTQINTLNQKLEENTALLERMQKADVEVDAAEKADKSMTTDAEATQKADDSQTQLSMGNTTAAEKAAGKIIQTTAKDKSTTQQEANSIKSANTEQATPQKIVSEHKTGGTSDENVAKNESSEGTGNSVIVPPSKLPESLVERTQNSLPAKEASSNTQSPELSEFESAKENELPERFKVSMSASPDIPILIPDLMTTLPAIQSNDFVLKEQVIKPHKERGSMYAAAFYSPTRNYKRIKTNRPGVQVITDRLKAQEKADYSYDIGTQVGYQFASGWGLESGLTYSQINVSSIQQQQIRFNRIGERPNGSDEFVNDYQAMINTSFGTVSTGVTLARSSTSSIDQNAFINLSFETRQQLEFLRLPLMLTYERQLGKLKVMAKGGMAGSYLMANELTIRRARSLHNGTRLQEQSRVIKNSFGNLKRVTLDVQFGLAISYSLSDKLDLMVSPTYNQSITPIFNKMGIKTLPGYTGLQLGLKYNF